MDRKTSLTILIALFLASCAKAEIPPTLTSTPIPTSSPIPSPTFTATPTEDPPADAPEGTTGKNSNGDWTRTVEIDDKKVEQIYQVIRDKEGNILYEEWVRVKTPGDGISLVDGITDEYLGYDQMGRIQVYCSAKFEGCPSIPKFTHDDLISEERGPGVGGRLGPIIKDRLGITGKLYDYQVSHPNGLNFNFFLTYPEHPLTWTMRPEPHSSVVEILTDWNDPILDGGQDIRISTSLNLRSKILGVDQDGRLIGVVALNELPPEGAEYDDWRTDVWNAAIFLHSSMVLQQEDVLHIEDTDVLSEILDAATRNNIQWVIQQPDN